MLNNKNLREEKIKKNKNLFHTVPAIEIAVVYDSGRFNPLVQTDDEWISEMRQWELELIKDNIVDKLDEIIECVRIRDQKEKNKSYWNTDNDFMEDDVQW